MRDPTSPYAKAEPDRAAATARLHANMPAEEKDNAMIAQSSQHTRTDAICCYFYIFQRKSNIIITCLIMFGTNKFMAQLYRNPLNILSLESVIRFAWQQGKLMKLTDEKQIVSEEIRFRGKSWVGKFHFKTKW